MHSLKNLLSLCILNHLGSWDEILPWWNLPIAVISS